MNTEYPAAVFVTPLPRAYVINVFPVTVCQCIVIKYISTEFILFTKRTAANLKRQQNQSFYITAELCRGQLEVVKDLIIKLPLRDAFEGKINVVYQAGILHTKRTATRLAFIYKSAPPIS